MIQSDIKLKYEDFTSFSGYNKQLASGRENYKIWI